MQTPSKIAHPLKYRTGTSQRTRNIDVLQPEAAPIDGKTLADQLAMIGEYARYVNFYEYQNEQGEEEHQEVTNWVSFFEHSLPFQLAYLSKISISDLEAKFTLLHNELLSNPSKHALESLLDFVYSTLIAPTDVLYRTVAEAENSFHVPLLAIVKSAFLEGLVCYIALHNASATFLCVAKKNFNQFLNQPWQLKVGDIYAFDACIKNVKKGKKEAFLLAADTVATLFNQMLNGLQNMVDKAPDFIEESLYPYEESLQKKHEPHVALLFTFLELFKHFQGNINELGKKHLDFFYEQVLKLVPKEAVPDSAHIVFEVAKHLEAYPLPKDLLLKDGKDANGQDIQFGLDHELVLDKAQVKDLRSLSLNTVKINTKAYTEGVYIAPVANSLDGLGKKFKEEQGNNWATLGAKYSKYVEEGKLLPEEHPKARIGFVLSSPVLLLQEGKRIIDISLDCNLNVSDLPLCTSDNLSNTISEKLGYIADQLNANQQSRTYRINQSVIAVCNLSDGAKAHLAKILLDTPSKTFSRQALLALFKAQDPIDCRPIFSFLDKIRLIRCLYNMGLVAIINLFHISFSGVSEWLFPEPEAVTLVVSTTASGLKLDFNIILDTDFPAIVFYDEENLKEKFDLKDSFPLVKVALNDAIKINCDEASDDLENCCLKKSPGTNDLFISTYHFLRELQLVNAHIDVNVCGVKNLIVQNDENLQDVNKPIYPFGPRPKVGENWFIDGGANFYIGSKEVFCKNWQKFWITTTWKDKPADMHEHYRFYRDPAFENGDEAIVDLSFRFATSLLHEGEWIKDGKNKNTPPPPFEVDPINGDFSLGFLDGELLPLFGTFPQEPNPCEPSPDVATNSYNIHDTYFTPNGYEYRPKSMPVEPLEPLTVNTRKGFTKLTLAGVSFQHETFTYVLTRQMMALADLVDPQSIADALVELENIKLLSNQADALIVLILNDLGDIITSIDALRNDIGNNIINNSIVERVNDVVGFVSAAQAHLPGSPGPASTDLGFAQSALTNLLTALGTLSDAVVSNTVHGRINNIIELADAIESNITKSIAVPIFTFPPLDLENIHRVYLDNNLDDFGLEHLVKSISTKVDIVLALFDTKTKLGLPKEPYTPLIKSLSINYHALAEKDDMEIVHLYPFENTSKSEDIEQDPTLFPYFDEEGTLFIGVDQLSPGGTMSLLFQLAEATADSEQDRALINWHYLTGNEWAPLRPHFEVLSDETEGFTVSGIVTLAIPDTISKTGNTVMPTDLYWIKVSTPKNVRAIAETIGIHTQAAKASARFNELHDTKRLEASLAAGSIAKLVEGDFSVKKAEQPYSSFGGRKPEAEGHFYTRVSEHLKHKGRALMLNDYEKIVLEGFPEIYKTKCISHTMGLSANVYHRDLELAPGYVVVAVLPDLNKLRAGNQLEPKVPLSLLEKIAGHLRLKCSPFARLKVMNPRYEYVNVCIAVRLYRGKPKNFYAQKLKEDISLFLAPWFLGDSEKLAFGEEVRFSDIVAFVEQLTYVDFIANLKLEGECEQTGTVIKPLTARSVLTAGEICVAIDDEKCLPVENTPHELK